MTLSGLAASPGVAEGPARVGAGPDDLVDVESGEVLVSVTTSPANFPCTPPDVGTRRPRKRMTSRLPKWSIPWRMRAGDNVDNWASERNIRSVAHSLSSIDQ